MSVGAIRPLPDILVDRDTLATLRRKAHAHLLAALELEPVELVPMTSSPPSFRQALERAVGRELGGNPAQVATYVHSVLRKWASGGGDVAEYVRREARKSLAEPPRIIASTASQSTPEPTFLRWCDTVGGAGTRVVASTASPSPRRSQK